MGKQQRHAQMPKHLSHMVENFLPIQLAASSILALSESDLR